LIALRRIIFSRLIEPFGGYSALRILLEAVGAHPPRWTSQRESHGSMLGLSSRHLS
jgi:hypothetical protein